MVHGFAYRHVNCFAIGNAAGELLAFDAGWPCSLPGYRRAMKDAGLDFSRIRACVVSHMHLDHAGLVGEFIKLGIDCLATPYQAEALAGMESTILGHAEYRGYEPARLDPRLVLTAGGIAGFLAARGFECAILSTPGHSADSLSLVTAAGEALVGDLPPPFMIMPDDLESLRSWEALRDAGARRFHHAHGDPPGP